MVTAILLADFRCPCNVFLARSDGRAFRSWDLGILVVSFPFSCLFPHTGEKRQNGVRSPTGGLQAEISPPAQETALLVTLGAGNGDGKKTRWILNSSSAG